MCIVAVAGGDRVAEPAHGPVRLRPPLGGRHPGAGPTGQVGQQRVVASHVVTTVGVGSRQGRFQDDDPLAKAGGRLIPAPGAALGLADPDQP